MTVADFLQRYAQTLILATILAGAVIGGVVQLNNIASKVDFLIEGFAELKSVQQQDHDSIIAIEAYLVNQANGRGYVPTR